MRFTLRHVKTRESMTFFFPSFDSVLQIRRVAGEYFAIPFEQVKLLCNAKFLLDNQTISDVLSEASVIIISQNKAKLTVSGIESPDVTIRASPKRPFEELDELQIRGQQIISQEQLIFEAELGKYLPLSYAEFIVKLADNDINAYEVQRPPTELPQCLRESNGEHSAVDQELFERIKSETKQSLLGSWESFQLSQLMYENYQQNYDNSKSSLSSEPDLLKSVHESEEQYLLEQQESTQARESAAQEQYFQCQDNQKYQDDEEEEEVYEYEEEFMSDSVDVDVVREVLQDYNENAIQLVTKDNNTPEIAQIWGKNLENLMHYHPIVQAMNVDRQLAEQDEVEKLWIAQYDAYLLSLRENESPGEIKEPSEAMLNGSTANSLDDRRSFSEFSDPELRTAMRQIYNQLEDSEPSGGNVQLSEEKQWQDRFVPREPEQIRELKVLEGEQFTQLPVQDDQDTHTQKYNSQQSEEVEYIDEKQEIEMLAVSPVEFLDHGRRILYQFLEYIDVTQIRIKYQEQCETLVSRFEHQFHEEEILCALFYCEGDIDLSVAYLSNFRRSINELKSTQQEADSEADF